MNRCKPTLAPLAALAALAIIAIIACSLWLPPIARAADVVDVAAALERAKTSRTPLLITFCADWSPECNHLRTTLFARLDFWEKMKSFEHVAIDSDAELAQIWGERIVERGYPTMLVASPDAIELMRLPAWLPPEQILEALDSARALMAPVRDIIAYAEAKEGPLTEASWRVLAYHSWSQDRQLERTPREFEKTMRGLIRHPLPLHLPRERSRIMTRWLGFANQVVAGERRAETKSFFLEELDRRDADIFLRDLLTDSELVRLNLDFLLYSAGSTVELLHPRPGPERARLMEAWLAATETVRRDPHVPIAQRAAAMIPRIELFALNGAGGEVPKSLQDEVAAHVDQIARAAKEPFDRQAAIPTAGWLLEQVGDQRNLENLYKDQLKQARAPWLFMLSLARLERRRLAPTKALEWSRQAYDAATGSATRLRAGVEYLKQLMEITPDSVRQIETELGKFLRSSLAKPDAFDGANGQNLQALAQLLRTWRTKPSRSGVVTVIRETFARECKGQLQEQRCSDYFAAMGVD